MRELSIDEKNLKIVTDAMRKAVTDWDGTLRSLSSLDVDVIGKTGTATDPVILQGKLYEEPHAWVIGVFKDQGRQYAFVVNIAHGGWGEEAASVVKGFLERL